jgi:8-oxo-dGTP diphosphatase
MPMTIRTCLCLITRPAGPDPDHRELLLGFKKTGFGAGKWVGIGGHVEDGEAAVDATAREVAEETSLVVTPADMVHMACLSFVFPNRPSWDQTADVYVTASYAGEPEESDEVSPRWFATQSLPFDGMWDDAKYWLPVVLAGERVVATITFADDCATVLRTEPELRPAVISLAVLNFSGDESAS